MDEQAVMGKLQEVFDNVFLEPVTVTPDLSAASVAEWDSMTHITIIVMVEKKFNIRFRTGEVEKTQNVGDLVDLILRHLAGGR